MSTFTIKNGMSLDVERTYHHVTTVAVLFCYFRCFLLYSVAISLSSVVACRNISVLLMNVV